MDLSRQEQLWKAKQARLKAAAPVQQAAVPVKKGGIDPRAWISEAGGTLGGIGAGILSAGNPLAVAAGAAAGSAIGKSLEQAVKGEPINQKDVAIEAGLSGLFAGGPIRLGKSVLGAGVKKVAEEGTKQAAKGAFTRLQRQGIKQLGEAWGIDPGAKLIASGKAIGPKKANLLQNFARKIGVGKTSSAIDVQDVTEQFAKNTGTAIKNRLAGVKTTFNTKELLGTLDDEFKNILGLGGKKTPLMKDIQNQVRKANGNYAKLWELRKNIDKQLINFNKGTDLASTSAQTIADKTRRAINGVLKQVDGIGDDFANYNKASDILTLVGPAVRSPKGSVIPGTGLRVLGGTTQRAKAGIGSVMKGRAATGATARQVPSLLRTAAGQGARQLSRVGLQAAVVPPAPGAALEPAMGEEMGMEAMGLEAPAPTDRRLEVIRNAIVQDISKTGGKNLKNIQTIATAYGIDLTPLGLGTGAKTGFAALTADQQKRVSNLNTVAAAINQLEESVATSGFFPEEPQALSSLLGRVRGTVGAAITPEQRAYTASLRSRGIQIIRALGEVGNLSQTEQESAFQLLPQPGDNAQTAAAKIQQLRALFTDVAQRVAQPRIGTFE